MLLGFAGRKRCGKTTLAKMLQREENAVIVTVANYLKYLCCDLLNITYEELNVKKDNGYRFDITPDERWFKIISKRTGIDIDKVREELSGIHITDIRQMLQVVGTDVIRKYNVNWHIEQMTNEIKSYSEDKLIVVDDVRFPNERKAIEELGGTVFFILRPNCMLVSNHISETSLVWQNFDSNKIIINDSTKERLNIHFLTHFRNNFDCFMPHSIFLNENKEYSKFGNFGYKDDKDNPLLSAVLREIKEDKLFNEFGLIRFKTCDNELAKTYINEVDDTVVDIDKGYNIFITNNPLIVENLKAYL